MEQNTQFQIYCYFSLSGKYQKITRLPSRENFEPTKYRREKIGDPRNTHEKKLGTHQLPKGKKCGTHELPTRKTFGTHELPTRVRWHDSTRPTRPTMARDPPNLAHSLSSVLENTVMFVLFFFVLENFNGKNFKTFVETLTGIFQLSKWNISRDSLTNPASIDKILVKKLNLERTFSQKLYQKIIAMTHVHQMINILTMIV